MINVLLGTWYGADLSHEGQWLLLTLWEGYQLDTPSDAISMVEDLLELRDPLILLDAEGCPWSFAKGTLSSVTAWGAMCDGDLPCRLAVGKAGERLARSAVDDVDLNSILGRQV